MRAKIWKILKKTFRSSSNENKFAHLVYVLFVLVLVYNIKQLLDDRGPFHRRERRCAVRQSYELFAPGDSVHFFVLVVEDKGEFNLSLIVDEVSVERTDEGAAIY